MNRARLLAVPAQVVTVTGPADDGMAGTTAVIFDRERTVKTEATRPNRTALTLVKPDPVTGTFVPADPVRGLTELIRGAVRTATDNAAAGAAPAARPRPASATAVSTPGGQSNTRTHPAPRLIMLRNPGCAR